VPIGAFFHFGEGQLHLLRRPPIFIYKKFIIYSFFFVLLMLFESFSCDIMALIIGHIMPRKIYKENLYGL